MKIIDVEQGSPEWFQARMGIPTASEFSRIITPTGKASTSADGYANELLAEMMVGHPIETFQSPWMARGKELEEEAAAQYESLVKDTVSKVGFCINDEGTAGCSPDRLVGDDGLLEIKILKPGNHIGQLLEPTLDKEYFPQVQGQLYVTGRKWLDPMPFHSEMEPIIVRCFRDESYISEMKILLAKFNKMLKEKRQILVDKGYMK